MSDEVKTRRLPLEILAVCVTILLNMAAMIWWASAVNTRLDHLEAITKPLADGTLITTITRIDDRTTMMSNRVDKIADRLWQDDTTKAADKDK